MIDKIELNKRKSQAVGCSSTDNGGGTGGSTDLQKLKSTIKKLEEQKDLIAIEKEQLEDQIKERATETEELKERLRKASKSNQDLQVQYIASLRQLSDLNSKLHLVVSTLEAKEPLEVWYRRVEDLNNENERVDWLSNQAKKSSQNQESSTESD